MTATRRNLLFRVATAALTLTAACAVGLAGAQTAPPAAAGGKTIKLLVGFPPGGGTDAIARVLADRLKEELGSPVIVENKPGAGGQIAAQTLKTAPADGT